MYNIKYEISLNEDGRPCIELPEDYDQNPEDKFFALEIARYYMQMVAGNMDDNVFDQHTFRVMDEGIRLLGQLGDEVAAILYDGMRTQGEIAMMMAGSAYHVLVKSIEERDALPDKNIPYNNKLFDRVEGLKVGIVSEDVGRPYLMDEIYELKDGITNEHWVKI